MVKLFLREYILIILKLTCMYAEAEQIHKYGMEWHSARWSGLRSSAWLEAFLSQVFWIDCLTISWSAKFLQRNLQIGLWEFPLMSSVSFLLPFSKFPLSLTFDYLIKICVSEDLLMLSLFGFFRYYGNGCSFSSSYLGNFLSLFLSINFPLLSYITKL